MLNVVKTRDFWARLASMRGKRYDSLRIGQKYMNILYELDRDLYMKIHTTEDDIFYVEDSETKRIKAWEAKYLTPPTCY